jgi:hypothetical protein
MNERFALSGELVSLQQAAGVLVSTACVGLRAAAEKTLKLKDA